MHEICVLDLTRTALELYHALRYWVPFGNFTAKGAILSLIAFPA